MTQRGTSVLSTWPCNRLSGLEKMPGQTDEFLFPDTPRKVEITSVDIGFRVQMRQFQLWGSVQVQIRHHACPHCRHTDEKAILGDGRLYCRNCQRKFTPQASAWDSIRLPKEVKRTIVLRFVRNVSGYRKSHVPQPSANSRERIRQLCRAACALDGGISAPWEDVAFKLSDTDRREVELAGLKFTRIAGRNRVASFSRAEAVDRQKAGTLVTAHIGAFQPWGKQRDRVDLWLRRRHGRIITSEVQHEVVCRQSFPDPEPELLEFANGVSEFLRGARSIESRYLHLYVGEALIRHRDGASTGRLDYSSFRRLLMQRPVEDLYRVIRGS